MSFAHRGIGFNLFVVAGFHRFSQIKKYALSKNLRQSVKSVDGYIRVVRVIRGSCFPRQRLGSNMLARRGFSRAELRMHGAASCRWRDPAGAAHAAGPPPPTRMVMFFAPDLFACPSTDFRVSSVFNAWLGAASSGLVDELRSSYYANSGAITSPALSRCGRPSRSTMGLAGSMPRAE